MPTVFRDNGYRFFFFSNEHEPIHIHIEKGDKYAKIDVNSLELINSKNISSRELRNLIKIVKVHRNIIVEAWNEYFRRE